MKISIGSDHGGFDLKEEVCQYLKSEQITVDDCGCFGKESVDYPDYAKAVSKKVSDGESDYGILICTTGIGMSITANKFPKIRAALCVNENIAEMTRRHNNANVLCLGARYTPFEEAKKLVDIFLSTQFEGGRHLRRVEKISAC